MLFFRFAGLLYPSLFKIENCNNKSYNDIENKAKFIT